MNMCDLRKKNNLKNIVLKLEHVTADEKFKALILLEILMMLPEAILPNYTGDSSKGEYDADGIRFEFCSREFDLNLIVHGE